MRWKLEKNPREHVHIRSLRTRFLLPVLFVALAVTAISAVTFLRVWQAAERDASASTYALARMAALGPERVVGDVGNALGSFAADPSVGARNWSACSSAAAAVLAANPHYADVGIAGADGMIICDGAGFAGRNVASEAFFKRALANSGIVAGNYSLEAGGDRPVIGFGLRIVSRDETPSGVAFVILRLSAFDPLLVAPTLPSEAGYGVTDGRGTMLARLPEKDGWAGQRLPEETLVTELLTARDGAVALRGVDGIDRTYAFTRIVGTGPAPLSVYVGVPVAAAFANQRGALIATGIVAIALFFLAVWLALALGDMLILKRVRRLAESMRLVVAGDLKERETLQYGMGELDGLTAVFDAITAKLEEAYSSQEHKVQKRTVELEFNKGMAELEKARTEALLTSIGDGLFATDETGKISFVNQEAERMLGFFSVDIVGRPAYSVFQLEDDKGNIIPREKLPTMVAIETRVKYVSPVYPKPYYFVRKDKTRLPVQITVTPIIAAGETVGTIQVFRDITAEIEFDRRKSEFISIASHQLRSPLSAVKWLTDMLRKGDVGPLQPKQQEFADKLFDANERMVTLVNELLNVSRLEAGTVKLSPVETDMGKLIEDALTEAMPLLAAKKQTFERRIVDVPHLTIDASLIREAFTNIVSNASKYSPDGSVITVTLEQTGDVVAVSVADQGMGIPASDQDQMFKKFFRAGNAAKSVVVGTGLGLYVCKAIVELHGGRIGFAPAPEKGTVFTITLPVNSVPLAAGEVHLT